MEWAEEREVLAAAFAELAEACRKSESDSEFAPQMLTVMFTAMKMLGGGFEMGMRLASLPFGGVEALEEIGEKMKRGELG